jgi:hypothetical protein
MKARTFIIMTSATLALAAPAAQAGLNIVAAKPALTAHQRAVAKHNASVLLKKEQSKPHAAKATAISVAQTAQAPVVRSASDLSYTYEDCVDDV